MYTATIAHMQLPMCEYWYNLPPILHSFQDIMDYWSNFYYLLGVPRFYALIQAHPLTSRMQNLASRNY